MVQGKGDGGGGCVQDAGLRSVQRWGGGRQDELLHIERPFEGKSVVPLERACDFELNGILLVLSTVGMACSLVARCWQQRALTGNDSLGTVSVASSTFGNWPVLALVRG